MKFEKYTLKTSQKKNDVFSSLNTVKKNVKKESENCAKYTEYLKRFRNFSDCSDAP